MTLTPSLRAAAPSDAEALSVLLGQLGYPAIHGEIPLRLARLESHPGAAALVADVNGRVVGVVTVHVFPSIHSTVPAAWLTTLVVDEGARGQGIGHIHSGRRFTKTLSEA